jgi:hypothetical protein
MKWDLDSHTSSRSLTHPAGNLNNKPAARNDHTAQPETEPALNRFALKPLALRREPGSGGHLSLPGRGGRWDQRVPASRTRRAGRHTSTGTGADPLLPASRQQDCFPATCAQTCG